MWSTTKLAKTAVDNRMVSSVVSIDECCSVFQPSNLAAPVIAFPSTFSDRLNSPVFAAESSVYVADAKWRYSHAVEQQIPEGSTEGGMPETTCQPGSMALLQCKQPPTRPPNPPLDLVTFYRSQFLTRLVSSLFGANSTSSAVQEMSSPASLSIHKSRYLSVPRRVSPHVGTGHQEIADKVGVLKSRGDPVNWLLDKPGESTKDETSSSAVSVYEYETSRQAVIEQAALKMGRCNPPCVGGKMGIGCQRLAHSGGTEEGIFFCRLCCKSYATPGAMKMHARTHTLPCRCGVCGKAFSRPWLLQGHLRTHTGERPFACSQCQRAFADRSNLRAHLQTHAVVKKYACSRCAKTFSRMSLLGKHEDGNSCPGRVPKF